MKGGSLPDGAFDPDPATHLPDQLRGDSQAQARAAMSAGRRFIGLRKGFENARLLRLGNAAAGIRNVKVQVSLAVGSGLDRDAQNHFSLLGKLDRVVEQVDQDLPKPHRVAD